MQKTIPMGAGLGGGSADAAACLVGLDFLEKTRLSTEALMKLGLKLGADVPFMLNGGTAIVNGIGEQITALNPICDCFILIAKPKISINTKKAYEDYDKAKKSSNKNFNYEPTINPIRTKLSTLKLSVGDKLSMEYDYGAGWGFEIKLLSIVEMKRGAGTHYPYVTDGKGKGIIEDISPYELAEIVEKTDKDGTLPQIIDMYSDKEVSWDYRKFDLEYCNVFLKDDVWEIQNAYEEFE